MKSIPPSGIMDLIHPEATAVSLRDMHGLPCREISVVELRALVAAGYVVGKPRRRGKLTLAEVLLTVPADQAFRALGESGARVKDLFHSDASVTVLPSAPGVGPLYKQHHTAHCFAWPHLARDGAQ